MIGRKECLYMELLTSRQFAKEIGVSITTLGKWYNQGILKPYLITPGGRKKYTMEQVEKYYAEAKQKVRK